MQSYASLTEEDTVLAKIVVRKHGCVFAHGTERVY